MRTAEESLTLLRRLGFQQEGENLVFQKPENSLVEWPKQGIAIPEELVRQQPHVVDKVVERLSKYKQINVME